ncbi:uncharacterized protein LOC118185446 isoform X2 [Stegodyphus dumicola]|uniref:uncharacterized protein LOC118185446 isoform X2 n=1 Tax=Stegodyphus dumicola TaxID=202533 RepID=UPI0015A8B8B5|nr:uncharacterized protein LOC118185446 isoform X2 [Stegodyphus dumicola]
MEFLFPIIMFLSYVAADPHSIYISPYGTRIVLEEGADLNLTCKVKTKLWQDKEFDLSWKLPTQSSVKDRILINKTKDQLAITIQNLQKNDTGPYICELQNDGIISSRKISVSVRSKKCVKRFFDCGGGICISKRYVCDGYVDCSSGYDESVKLCGPNPCHGKILCDGRCIPQEFCCDPTVSSNCSISYLMPCCREVLDEDSVALPCPPSVDCHIVPNFGIGCSILHVVAICAAVVIVISTAALFLAYRICSERTEQLHRWSRVSENEFRAAITSRHGAGLLLNNGNFLHERENFNSDQYERDSQLPDYLVRVNYVPGSGYQVADSRPKPPPYTENSIGIPPPPYESNSNIADVNKEDCQLQRATSNNETSG